MRQIYGNAFPLNLMEVSFCASIIAIVLYVLVSILTCRKDFNLEQMLHRGEYSDIKEKVGEAIQPAINGKLWLGKLSGFDENFSLVDKWITGGLLAWTIFWFGVFVIGTLWNLADPWPVHIWSSFWQITGIGLPICFSVITAIWFTWGGVRDIRDLFRRLREQKENPLDDGTVVNHQNMDEAALSSELCAQSKSEMK